MELLSRTPHKVHICVLTPASAQVAVTVVVHAPHKCSHFFDSDSLSELLSLEPSSGVVPLHAVRMNSDRRSRAKMGKSFFIMCLLLKSSQK